MGQSSSGADCYFADFQRYLTDFQRYLSEQPHFAIAGYHDPSPWHINDTCAHMSLILTPESPLTERIRKSQVEERERGRGVGREAFFLLPVF